MLRTRVFQVWLTLMAVTVLSWWLGTPNTGAIDDANRDARLASTLIVLAIAFVKLWLVIRYFMETRRAPRSLRMICDGWLIVVAAGIVSLYPLGLW